MILTILVAALLFTLFVLQRYIACKEHSRTHRLLPLMLGIICITDFYQIVEYLTGEYVVFSFLEELLMLQTHYFLMQYIMDVLKIRFRKEIRIFLFIGLVAADISMILAYRENANAYNMIFWLALGSYVITMIYYTVKAYFVRSYSIKERFVNIALFLAIIIPGMGLVAQYIINRPWGEAIVPVTLCCSCGIVLYLMETHQLADTTTLLIENLYDTSEIAVVLIDQDYYYLDANEAAHRLFAKEFAMLSGKKKRISCKEQLKNLLKNPKEGVEFVSRGGAYYQCILQPVTFHNRKKGYILSAVDITKQKQETALMAQLKETGRYALPDDMLERIRAQFLCGRADDNAAFAAIRDMWQNSHYLMDTHTAVAYSVYAQLKAKGLITAPAVVLSTASPFKFAPAMLKALGEYANESGFDAADKLSALTGLAIPAGLGGIRELSVLHTDVIDPAEMGAYIHSVL